MKRLSAKELLAENPNATADDLEITEELLAKLRAAGLDRPRYRLASPLTGRHASHSARLETHAHVARRH